MKGTEKLGITPGEWYIQVMEGTLEDERPDFWLKSKENNTVGYGTDIMADDYGEQNGYPKEQRIADGKLICAAPELYNALVLLTETLEERYGNTQEFKIAKSAIKLAEEGRIKLPVNFEVKDLRGDGDLVL